MLRISPCKNCPFLKTAQRHWLGETRMKEICTDTVMGDKFFTCHKTLELPQEAQLVCAGSLLLEKKVNPNGNKSSRFMMAFGYLKRDYSNLKGEALVFDSVEEAVNHHS